VVTIGAQLEIFFTESGKSMLNFQFGTNEEIGQYDYVFVVQCGHSQ
jgi:hypothetical protein